MPTEEFTTQAPPESASARAARITHLKELEGEGGAWRLDTTTVLGFVLALSIVILPILGGYESFMVPQAFLFVVGGTLGATILSVPRRHLIAALGALRIAFVEKPRSARRLVRTIVELSEIARRDGILALEPYVDRVSDRFLRRGLELAVDGTDPQSIALTLQEDMEQTRARHAAGKIVLEVVARYAPAFGMLGTLAGLILMLSTQSDVQTQATARSILPRMAFALVTTFYGLFISNAVALPLAEKLAQKDEEEATYMKIVLNGILAIQNGDNPRVVERKLAVFLTPYER